MGSIYEVPPPGFTDEEVKAWRLLKNAAGAMMRLPEQHPMEKDEYAHAFHELQYRMLARPVQRKWGADNEVEIGGGEGGSGA